MAHMMYMETAESKSVERQIVCVSPLGDKNHAPAQKMATMMAPIMGAQPFAMVGRKLSDFPRCRSVATLEYAR